jgi:hypothetical protein
MFFNGPEPEDRAGRGVVRATAGMTAASARQAGKDRGPPAAVSTA